jgi:hypothetical protein
MRTASLTQGGDRSSRKDKGLQKSEATSNEVASLVLAITERFRGVSHDHPEEATDDSEEITGYQAQRGKASQFDKERQTGSERSYFPAPL